jgi:hypothetical protein
MAGIEQTATEELGEQATVARERPEQQQRRSTAHDRVDGALHLRCEGRLCGSNPGSIVRRYSLHSISIAQRFEK